MTATRSATPGPPNYGPRAKSHPQRHFLNDEKIIYLRNTCCFGRM